MTWRIGVDIGGTFADLCALDERTGELHTLKVLTTPDAPGREIVAGLALLGGHCWRRPAPHARPSVPAHRGGDRQCSPAAP
jgi:N-methylhydantoinase A